MIEEEEPTFEELLENFNDGNVWQRGYIVKILGELGDTRAIDPLIEALNDEWWEVREHVAEALGEFKNPRVIKALISTLYDDKADVRISAADSLLQLGEDVQQIVSNDLQNENEKIRVIAEELYEEYSPEKIQRREAEGLAVIETFVQNEKKEEQEPTFEELLEQLKDEDDYKVREAASRALENLGDRRTLEIQLKNELDNLSNFEHIQILTKYVDFYTNKQNFWCLLATAINKLPGGDSYQIFKDRLFDIISKAFNDLKISNKKESVSLLKQIIKLDSIDPDIRADAVKALGELEGKQALDIMIEIAKGGGIGDFANLDDDLGSRLKAMSALQKIGGAKATEALTTILTSGCYDYIDSESSSGTVNDDIINSLRELGEGIAIVPLTEILSENSWEISGEARTEREQLVNDTIVDLISESLRKLKLGDGNQLLPLLDILTNKRELPFRDDRIKTRAHIRDSIDEFVNKNLPDFFAMPDISNFEKTWAAIYLAGLRYKTVVEFLIGALEIEELDDYYDSDTYYLKREIINTLLIIGDTRATESLLRVLNHEDGEVKECALNALGALGDSSAVQPLIELFNRKAKDSYYETVYEIEEIIEALVNLNVKEAVEPLKQFLEEINGGKYPDIPDAEIPDFQEIIKKISESLQKLETEPKQKN